MSSQYPNEPLLLNLDPPIPTYPQYCKDAVSKDEAILYDAYTAYFMLPIAPPCMATRVLVNDITGTCEVSELMIYQLTDTDIMYQIKKLDAGVALHDTVIITQKEYLTAIGVL
jgi:hypothetical protein